MGCSTWLDFSQYVRLWFIIVKLTEHRETVRLWFIIVKLTEHRETVRLWFIIIKLTEHRETVRLYLISDVDTIRKKSFFWQKINDFFLLFNLTFCLFVKLNFVQP